MSVIIRLQNLPWSANAIDIRQYFHGLSIPEGGVHIVGGEQGDAFIAFSTDEDARQAFMRNNGKIKEIQITLMLSSRTEMQRVIEQARAKSYSAFMQPSGAHPPGAVQPAPIPAAVPAIPAAIPQIKQDDSKDKSDRKDSRRRSRSKSKDRDRKDRSRDRDRKDRRRDRSRSRSRDRRSRRKDRSRSRNRSRSRDRDRRRRDDVKTKKPDDRNGNNKTFQKDNVKPPQQTVPAWANVNNLPPVDPPVMQTMSVLPPMNINLDQAKRAIVSMQLQHLQQQQQQQQQQQPQPPQQQQPPNGFPGNNFRDRDNNGPMARNRGRNWSNEPNFQNNRSNDGFGGDNSYDQYPFNRFQDRQNRHDDNAADSCVALEPFYGSYSDVRKFFSGLFISGRGIKFINDSAGRRTGIVYVQFGYKRSKEEALTMSGMRMNGVEVNISHLDDREFEEAVDRFIPPRNFDDDTNSNDANSRFGRPRNASKFFNQQQPQESPLPEITDFTCLTVEDLPTYCKEQDILHMFAQHPLVALILTSKKKGGPLAYVKFSSKEVAKKALEETSQHIVAGKQVTVKPCRDEEFEEINKEHDVNLNGPTKVETSFTSDCLSVSRLPLKTNDKDIADFFSDIGVIPEKIHLMSNNFGFTGQAYCEFTTVEEAVRATKKHESSLGSAVISVTPIKREEMNTILGSTLPAPPEQITGGSGLVSKMSKLENRSPPPEDMLNHPMDFHGPPDRPFFNRHFDNGPPMRGRGSRFGPRGGGGGGGVGGGGGRMRFHSPDEDDGVRPGCTVFMKNVPYKAGTNEILEFFDGFNHTGNVSRRYNPNNTPSDEAKVIFVNPDEAAKAVDELQKAKIWDRQIFLRQE